jgi:hypothetical protein
MSILSIDLHSSKSTIKLSFHFQNVTYESLDDIYSCAKHSSVGSSIASGMAAAITTGHPTSNWRDERQG